MAAEHAVMSYAAAPRATSSHLHETDDADGAGNANGAAAARLIDTAAIDCQGVSKHYDGIPVLRNITASFPAGAVTVLAGENGAGKSTLFKILTGQIAPDAGEIHIGGERIAHFSPLYARLAGISIIPQELLPIPDMLVYENLLIGQEIRDRYGFLNRRQMIRKAEALLESVELDVDPRMPMRRLSIAATQLVEIIKATSRNARIVLMDEPTSSLSSRETEHLFRVIDRLRRKEACILYTTHRMEEIATVADYVAVLRDGQLITQQPANTITEPQIVAAMVGREINNLFPDLQSVAAGAKARLKVDGLSVAGFGAENSFSLAEGEILGLGGLVGAGRSELLEAIFGLRHSSGSVELDGVPLPRNNVRAALGGGIAMVPEDRKLAGVVVEMNVLDNTTLPHIGAFRNAFGLLRRKPRRRAALDALNTAGVRYSSLNQKVTHLSGGNQQKIALARWLITQRPKVLILDEPTRGIDVSARSDLYNQIIELAKSGVSILLASSDMPELLNLSHRVLVFRAGRIVGELPRHQLDQETILRLAMGAADER
ncbi:sugar ABC transporter ATP-binding protein [Paraburkholderia ferrariae]|uniref:sugar ABC transporter ATP-binding protein n=1 Tax=Paraburkholderia ferrariae TaxID=386056 RepID=UPI000A4654A5|nr:sugar ABC transporter ATP-binding protein [Paraburkholderia ferrariae]